MNAERWRQVDRLYHLALEREPGDRAAFLAQACQGDEELRRDLDELLAQDSSIDNILERPAANLLDRPAPEVGADWFTQSTITYPVPAAHVPFPPGAILAQRYRIVHLLGRGGMGEVYRADDLLLEQPVALKFLPSAATASASLLSRFRNEVRTARQVSHPNVCRVHDIGEAEGLTYLSMEYVDGEDLASLLRRIGKLPQDKALEIARQLCAGLAAAHDKGVIHRDLKPANIMLDGKGHVRITDFGIAGVAEQIRDVGSGTPAYMSPEQKAGKEVTTRSDLYSLGLVLYEMFTGKRRTSTESNPTDLVKGLDPAVDRVILRCLEEEPKRRPSSALNVAMALPGGDPIAAALAAGETPSPEMVAASGEKEGFSARTAVLCFVGVVVLIAAGTLMSPRLSLFGPGRAQIDIPPEALAFRAQDILKQLGYTEQPQSTAYGFDCCDAANLRFVEQHGARRDALLASHQPPVIRFWYRQHQGQFLADPATGAITYDLPANVEPEMVRLALDAKGRLIALEARPWETVASGASNWTFLFAAAGLDLARFTPVSPERVPPMAVDMRMAWTGTYGQGRPEQVRVEAAAWQGRPVYFDVAGDWHRQSESTGPPRPVQAVLAFLGVCVVGGAALMAWRNLRLGRGDQKGAGRIAAFVFLSGMCARLLATAHVASFWEFQLLVSRISVAGFISGLVWLAYLAIEPYARRHWPDSLISWNRLLAGRLRDPLVASHVLAGFFALWAGVIIFIITESALVAVSAPPMPEVPPSIASLNSTKDFAAGILRAVGDVLVNGMEFLVLVMLLRLLLRRVWIADLLTAAVLGLAGVALDFSNPYRFAVTWAAYMLLFYVFLWLLGRFGLLAVMAMFLVNNLIGTIPYASFTSWYVGRLLVANGIMVAIAVWALWVILSAKRGTESAPA
jgi:hypothetical protein